MIYSMTHSISFKSIRSLMLFAMAFLLLQPNSLQAVAIPDHTQAMVYFYTTTCPFCQQQDRFLRELQTDFPDLEIARFDMTQRSSAQVQAALIQQFPQAERFQGSVPLTFYQDDFFIGFNEVVAQQMRQLVASVHTDGTISTSTATDAIASATVVSIPLWGEVETANLSAPLLAIVLGIVDGFNVCSVGALILILSIVLKFRDRRLILVYGTIFIVVTAIVYFALIFAWYQLFQFVAPHLPFFEVIIGLLAIAGGSYFLREFIRFQRYGVTCESGSNAIITSVTKYVQETVVTGAHAKIALAVALFAGIVTLIEFPCSAAIPLTLAATLATMELSTTLYLGSMLLFIFFYLLDELLIFLIAVWSMRLWVNSNGFVKYASLIGSLILFAFGLYYIFW